jgi:hypothetical protein
MNNKSYFLFLKTLLLIICELALRPEDWFLVTSLGIWPALLFETWTASICLG